MIMIKRFFEDMPYPEELNEYVSNIESEMMGCYYDQLKSFKVNTKVSTIQLYRGKLLERIFAVRTKREKVEVMEVCRNYEDKTTYVKNIYQSAMSGWIVVWYDKYPSTWYWNDCDRDQWYMRTAYTNISCIKLYDYDKLISLKPTMKYSSLDLNRVYDSICKWVNEYEMYPELEVLWKFNIYNTAYVSICKMIRKNKKFIKYLVDNKESLIKSGAKTCIGAFNKHMSVVDYIIDRECAKEIKNSIYKKYDLNNEKTLKYLHKLFSVKDTYVAYHNFTMYHDLLNAVDYLKLDMKQDKNVYPHDFKYWHDYYTGQVEISKSAHLDSGIKTVAEHYKKAEMCVGGFILMMPRTTAEFIAEGQAMNNCVGRMGYNKKMSDNNCLIFFVRAEDNPEKSLYTMEYDQNSGQIRQLYAEHNRLVPNEVRELINKKWLPKIRKIESMEVAA